MQHLIQQHSAGRAACSQHPTGRLCGAVRLGRGGECSRAEGAAERAPHGQESGLPRRSGDEDPALPLVSLCCLSFALVCSADLCGRTHALAVLCPQSCWASCTATKLNGTAAVPAGSRRRRQPWTSGTRSGETARRARMCERTTVQSQSGLRPPRRRSTNSWPSGCSLRCSGCAAGATLLASGPAVCRAPGEAFST